MTKILLILIFSFSAHAKNLILFIGDGMGPAVVTATRYYNNNEPIFLDKMPYTAKVRTYSKNGRVTDSAAAATAMATGVKVNNEVIGHSKGNNSIIENAKKLGMSVGIVTTTYITHATPAAFYARVPHRTQYDLIFDQLLESKVDLIIGGGKKHYKDNNNFSLIESMAELSGLEKLDPTKPSMVLLNESHLPYWGSSKRDRSTSLSAMTIQAIRLLSQNKKGFFLLVEGGSIDLALHVNEIKSAIYEADNFSKAIETASKNVDLSNTLIMATADHDTAGLSINGYLPHKADVFGMAQASGTQYPHLSLSTGQTAKYLNGKKENGKDMAGAHNAVDVPLYAIGKASEKVHGTIENTYIYQLMKNYLESK